jgi:pentatricopeptide repeat protein
LADAKLAKEIFHKMKRHFSRVCQPNLITCNTLIDMYVRLEMYERVDAVFAYMLAERIFPDSVTLTAMYAMYGKLGQPEKGDELLQVMQDCYIRPDKQLVHAIVHMYCTCGNPERAAKVWRELVERYEVPRDVVCYSILLDCYAKRREVAKAEALMTEMMAHGIEPDLKTYTILLTLYASCHGAESLRKAKDVYAFMSSRPDLTLDLVAYTVLIDTFAARGEHEVVQQLYSAMLAQGLEPNAIIKTAVSMLRIGSQRVSDSENSNNLRESEEDEQERNDGLFDQRLGSTERE